jgi:hypothetical protein
MACFLYGKQNAHRKEIAEEDLPIRSIDFYYPEFQAANALIVRDKSKICFLEGLK